MSIYIYIFSFSFLLLGGTTYGQNNWDAGMELVYRRMTGKQSNNDPRWQIKRWPIELIQWPIHNSNRRDISLLQDWLLPPQNQNIVKHALPADEAFGWSDFLTEGAACGVDGAGGTQYQSPGPWLLIYWMQEYFGIN